MKRTPFHLPALIGICLLSCASLSHAGEPVNVIFASTTIDNMDAFDGDCSLREAIHNASNNTQFSPVLNECPAGSASMTDVIRLAGGATYELTLAGAGNDEGDLDLFQNVPIALDLRFETDGGLGGVSTIQQTVVGQRVLHNLGLTVQMDNIIVRGGSVPGDVGGGILNDNGNMTLNNVTVISNSAISGAGIYTTGNLTVSNSQVVLNTASLLGGGLLNDGGELNVQDSQVRANQAVTGGGIYNAGGSAGVTDSSVNLNTATNGPGGGILNASGGSVGVSNSAFEGNMASTEGGAVANESQLNLAFFDSRFEGNNAVVGGAIAGMTTGLLHIVRSEFRDNSSASHGGAVRGTFVNVFDSLLEDNIAFLGDGGALYITTSLTMGGSTLRGNNADEGGAAYAQIADITDSTISANQASSHGGGVFLTNRGDLSNTIFLDNAAAGNGGGLYITSDNAEATTIKRGLFTGNQAGAQGGGLWLAADDVRIGNTTIHNNTANAGGGMYIASGGEVLAVNMTLAGHLAGQDLHKLGKLTMGNSIIYTPGQPDCETTLDDPPIYTLGNNVVDDDSCFFDQVLPSDLLVANPMLGELADNGGGTMTLALLPGSALIDAGSNVLCDAAPVDGVDQRGAPRPIGVACDIGAHEQGAIAPTMDEIFADGFE